MFCQRPCLRGAPAVVAHNGKHGDAVPQIFTKAAVLYHGSKIWWVAAIMRHLLRSCVRRQRAQKHLPAPPVTAAPELPVQFTNLIQEKTSPISALEPAPTGAYSAVNSFLMTEEFRVNQVWRDSTTVDRMKGPAARAERVWIARAMTSLPEPSPLEMHSGD